MKEPGWGHFTSVDIQIGFLHCDLPEFYTGAWLQVAVLDEVVSSL